MDDNMKNNDQNEEQNVEQEIKETQKAIKDGASLAKNVATRNVAGAAKDAVKLVKNKKVRNKIIRGILIKILVPVLIVLLLGSALYVVFDVVASTIQEIIDGIDGFYDRDPMDGSIHISDDEIDAIIKSLEDLGISAEDLGLLGEFDEYATEQQKKEQMRIYIRKFFEAQATTESLNYDHKDSTPTKAYGSVYVYRATGENTDDTNSAKKLTYKKYEDMKKMQEDNKEDALNYFSIDDSGNLVVAGTTTTIVNGKKQPTVVTLRSINYRSAISKYTTKMNFLVYLTLISHNPEFVSALVDLIKDSRIHITIMDNVTKNVETKTYKYTKHTRRRYSRTDEQGNKHHYYGNTKSAETETTTTTVINTNPTAKITYVRTWFCEQKITYRRVEKGPTNSDYTLTGDDTEYLEDEEPITGNNTGSWKTNQSEKYENSYYETLYEEATRGDVKIILGEQGDGERYKNGEIEIPTFVGLMETRFRIPYSTREEEAGSNIVSGAEMLFELLQKDPQLENMEQIMRYAINLYLGYERYEVNLDGSIFEIGDFTDVSGSSGGQLLKDYIRYFEHSSNPPTSADGKRYIIEKGAAGEPVVGYGVDINSHSELFIQAGYPINIGGEVDKEFVDAIEDQIRESYYNQVKDITSGLNLQEYQLHALTSRAYNCGVAGALTITRGSPEMNFVNSYNAYWNENTDDKFKEKNNNADFGHSLYTQYLSKPATANGEFLAGLEKRRKSEWTLFQTGYYDVLNKWYEEGGAIIECAEEIHQYMEDNNYTYCVYGSNPYEECSEFGKKHGLNRTFEESKTGFHNTCCATYVKWVLQEAGYLGDNEGSDGANALSNILAQKGWILITDESELKPGDILSYNGHVEIYAGDGKIYNAGSGDAIRDAAPSNVYRDFEKAYRAPN